MIEQVTQALCDRLSPLRDLGILVRGLPNAPNELGEIQDNGVITISWMMDEPQAPASRGVLVQDCLSKWMIDGRIRNLRDEAGLSALRQSIYALLLGFKAPGCKGKMYAERFEFTERQQKFWRFEAVFVAPTLLIELGEDDSGVAPLLKLIEFEETVNSYPVPTPIFVPETVE